MAEFDDPLNYASSEYLLRQAEAPAAKPKLLEEIVDTYGPKQISGFLGNIQNSLAKLSPAYAKFAGITAQPSTPFEGIPNRVNLAAAPIVGKDMPIDLVRAIIRQKESNNNYVAQNKVTTASGAYQYTDGTWNGYGGYAKAKYAPREIQDARFNEDLLDRAKKYNGDPFKMIAAHYLPKYANRPETWNQPLNLGKRSDTKTVAEYIRYVVKGTQLEKPFEQYLAQTQ